MGRREDKSIKILVIGPYREKTQNGRLCKDLILSLNAANADVYCKNYELDSNEKITPDSLISIENKPINGVDILLECLPPLLMEYDSRCGLNVGVCDLPTYPPPISWSNKANLLDFHLQTNHIKLGNKPSYIFPVGTDTNKYSLDYPKIKELQEFHKDRFLFYSIGEYSKKSGFSDIFRSIFAEFKHWEQVGLVLKVTSKHFKEKDLLDKIYNDIRLIQAGIGIERTIPVMILTEDKYKEEQVHQECDCYIDANHGFDVHFNGIEAIEFNKNIIVHANDQNWFGNLGGAISRNVPVYAAVEENYKELYSGNKYWIEFDLRSLMQVSREIFKNKEKPKHKMDTFSYEAVGQRLLGILNEQQTKTSGIAGLG